MVSSIQIARGIMVAVQIIFYNFAKCIHFSIQINKEYNCSRSKNAYVFAKCNYLGIFDSNSHEI